MKALKMILFILLSIGASFAALFVAGALGVETDDGLSVAQIMGFFVPTICLVMDLYDKVRGR